MSSRYPFGYRFVGGASLKWSPMRYPAKPFNSMVPPRYWALAVAAPATGTTRARRKNLVFMEGAYQMVLRPERAPGLLAGLRVLFDHLFPALLPLRGVADGAVDQGPVGSEDEGRRNAGRRQRTRVLGGGEVHRQGDVE